MILDVITESIKRFSEALPGFDDMHFRALCSLIIITIMLIPLVLIMFRFKRMRIVSGVLAVLFSSLVILLCIFYPGVELLYAHPAGDPMEIADAFLNSLSEGDIAGGYDALYGTSTQRNESEADEITGMYFDLIEKGFSYEYTSGMEVKDLDAHINARVYYSDLNNATENVKELFESELQDIVQSHSRREVYGDDDSYEAWAIEDAYSSASKKALKDAVSSCSGDIVLDLKYDGGRWNIVPTPELLSIMGCRVCGEPDSEKNLYDRVSLYENNTKSNVVSELMYIPKQYTIPEGSTTGYEPMEEGYHELTDPALIYEVINENQYLIGDQVMAFNPYSSFAANQKIYYYADDSILAIVWKEYCNNCYCNFAEVFVSDGSQIRRKLSGDTFGNGVQNYASRLAGEANAVVAMNGDFYKFRPYGICVYDRLVYRCTTQLDTCFFNSNGDMIFSYAGDIQTKEEAQQFVTDNDIVFSLAFGPVLIDNGVPKANLNYRIGETMQKYSRSAIGQLGEHHYLLMTIGHVAPYKECCVLKGAQDIMQLKGCINAYTLDGGQTAEIIWRDKAFSYVDWGVERTVSDILYFATAIPEDER